MLEIGSTYLTRDGHQVAIVDDDELLMGSDGRQSFIGKWVDGPDAGRTQAWWEDGCFYWWRNNSPHDLIKKI